MRNDPRRSNANLLGVTRRHFFGHCGVGLGGIALGSMLADEGRAGNTAPELNDPLAPRPSHFPAKAKRVIFLFMAGGPSHLELFDYKPKLQELDGQVIPPSYTKNKRFAFIKGDAKLLGSIMAAKRTHNLIPLCHPLAISRVVIDIAPDWHMPGLVVTASVKVNGPTGVEMEALTAAAVACLTIYDMVKAVERSMHIEGIRLLEKSGGKSGHYRAEA